MRMRMSLSTFSSLPLSTLSTMVPRRKETPTWVIPLHPEHTSTIRHFFLVICQILMDSVSLAKKWKFYVNLRLGSPQVRWTSVLWKWLEFFPGNISCWKFNGRQLYMGREPGCWYLYRCSHGNWASDRVDDRPWKESCWNHVGNLHRHGSKLWRKIQELEIEEEGIWWSHQPPYKRWQKPGHEKSF